MKKIILLHLILTFALFTINLSQGATFTVDNAGDADDNLAYVLGNGTNTLRKCIRLANSNANSPTVDIINFTSLPGVGPYVLVPTSNYPIIAEPVLIDGFTAPGYTALTPRIAIKGSGAAAAPSAIVNNFNFGPGSAGSTLRGFSLYRTTADGIYINGAPNITIEGCWIGLTEAGIVPASANSQIGGHAVIVLGGSTNCSIGTATANGRNVISGGRGHGVLIISSAGAQFYNNYIGTNPAGTAIMANAYTGINVDNSTNIIIGGSGANQSNLISGNTQSGIILTNASSNAVIKNNKVGTNLAGTAALANGQVGINIFTNVLNTQIGGPLTGEGNLVSGNGSHGINVDVASHGAVIQGNYIGTNSTGTAAIPNAYHGINVFQSNNVTIGGNTKFKRNIISGNGVAAGAYAKNGISINTSTGNSIQGNFIGVGANGVTGIPNYDTGLSMSNSSNNTIGGNAYMERNVISGNTGFGIYFDNIDNSTITQNFVGVDSTGLAARGNGIHGVSGNNGCNLLTWTNNIISGNGNNGADLLTMTNNTFYGNHFGLNVTGTAAIANTAIGFRLGLTSTNNIIGGSAAGQRNLFSGNGNHGMMIDVNSTGNIVKGNYIGSDITGLIAIPNQTVGLLLLEDANSNIIGGSASGEGNLFCCSATNSPGIQLNVSNSNVIRGNLIGTNKDGIIAAGFGNGGDGILLGSYWNFSASSSNNIIGGIAAGERNIITNNVRDGVRLAVWGGSNGTNFNPIIGNSIYCNGGLGINMEANLANENQGVPAPVVTSSTTNAVSGTGVNGYTVHVYRNQYTDGARCDCEGEIYVGSTVVAGGTWSLTHNLGLSAAQALSVTATQTNGANSTSEFWVCSVPLPMELLTLSANHVAQGIEVTFQVTKEANIANYHILKSVDGIYFEIIGTLNPTNKEGIHSYQFIDENPSNINYYRIQTVENNGQIAHSKIVQATNQAKKLVVYPNPATAEINIVSSASLITSVEIYSYTGQLLEKNPTNELSVSHNIEQLPVGFYLLKVSFGENFEWLKFEKK